MKKYKIANIGCDDSNWFNMELTEEELKVVIKLFEKNNKIAGLKLENKKMEKYINNIEKNIRKDIIKEYREKIAELKGHITKANILTLLK